MEFYKKITKINFSGFQKKAYKRLILLLQAVGVEELEKTYAKLFACEVVDGDSNNQTFRPRVGSNLLHSLYSNLRDDLALWKEAESRLEMANGAVGWAGVACLAHRLRKYENLEFSCLRIQERWPCPRAWYLLAKYWGSTRQVENCMFQVKEVLRVIEGIIGREDQVSIQAPEWVLGLIARWGSKANGGGRVQGLLARLRAAGTED